MASSVVSRPNGRGLTRREWLNYAWLASLGVLFVDLAGLSYLFLMPRFKPGEFGGIFYLGPASSAPPVGATPMNYPKARFWLVHTQQGLLALYKVCPHLGCLYGWNDQEGKFICPCHGSQFEYDGTYIRGPAPRSLDRFVMRAVDEKGNVIVETDPESGAPLPIPDAQDVTIEVDTGRRILGKPHD
ncbi:MAG: hypothetical protein Kow0047_05750 [Anaerolineae bacterium]